MVVTQPLGVLLGADSAPLAVRARHPHRTLARESVLPAKEGKLTEGSQLIVIKTDSSVSLSLVKLQIKRMKTDHQWK